MGALEPFFPDRMASRILGMGDVLSFVEKAQEAVRRRGRGRGNRMRNGSKEGEGKVRG